MKEKPQAPEPAPIEIIDLNGHLIAKVSGMAMRDAQRLVMCWNAFREMPDDTLRSMPGTVIDMLETMQDLYRYIDRLAGVLRKIDGILEKGIPAYKHHPVRQDITEVLAQTDRVLAKHNVH